ncbi:MAG: hypothetical protein JNM56_29115 [Planctomycetia bacterium]|nr:hypothetical protein [Planctomycetia bacterium]
MGVEGKGGDGKEGKGGEGKGGDPKAGGDGKGGEGKGGEGKGGDPKAGEGKGGEGKGGKGGEGKGGEGKGGKGGEGKGGEGKGGDPKAGGGEGKGGDPKAGGGKGGEGKGGDPKAGGDGKGGEGKGGESKSGGQGKGEAKGGQGKGGEGKPSESKGGGKGGEGGQGKAGEGKGGEGGGGGGQPKAGQPQQPKTPGKEQVEDAIAKQQKAQEDIRKKDNPQASGNQDDAIKKLDDARKKLEEILRQLREEEIERLLAQLQARCEYMLQLQKEVYEGTVRVDKAIGEHADKKPTRPDEQKSQQLADREALIVAEATKAKNLIEAEGTAVAFAEQFIQVIDDMKNVQKRLNKTDVGLFTQKIELDIIGTLEEMIEALKKAQKDMKAQQGQPGQPGEQGQPAPKNLIDLIAELKMIRSMQVKVNKRTEDYGKLYPGEQADDSDIRGELKNLGERQDKIKKIANDIATERNK